MTRYNFTQKTDLSFLKLGTELLPECYMTADLLLLQQVKKTKKAYRKCEYPCHESLFSLLAVLLAGTFNGSI